MMSDENPSSAELENFSGEAALFPLPNAVFHPGALFPLHIFEPRYRMMTADALAGDRLIAMALLKPGWEIMAGECTPAIYDMVCLSRIKAEEQLPDGRYYLVLQGLCRARVVAEKPVDLPYRIGQLEICSDDETGLTQSDDQTIREDLLRDIQSQFPELAVSPLLIQALDQTLPLGKFCDILAHALELPPVEAQKILETQNVRIRSELVMRALRSKSSDADAARQSFLPKFSRN